MMGHYSNCILSKSSSSKNNIAYDIEHIISEVGIRYSIHRSKEAYDDDSTIIYNVTDVRMHQLTKDLTLCSVGDV